MYVFNVVVMLGYIVYCFVAILIVVDVDGALAFVGAAPTIAVVCLLLILLLKLMMTMALSLVANMMVWMTCWG
jgi:hypothetical protein